MSGENRRGRTRALVTAMVVGAVGPLLTGVAPATAQTLPALPASATVVDVRTIPPVETPGIDPVLDAVVVEETPAIVAANRALDTAATDQNAVTLVWIQAEQRRADLANRSGSASQGAADAERALTQAQADLTDATAELERRRAVEDDLRAVLAIEQDRLRAVAATMVADLPADQYAFLGTYDDITAYDRRDAARDRGAALVTEAVDEAREPWAEARRLRRKQQRAVAVADRVVADATDDLTAAIDERDRFDELLAAASTQANTARADLNRAIDRSAEVLAERRAARLSSTVEGTDLPLVALHAYWRATALAPCSVPWWVIAGVGRVETRHGSASGSSLTASGDTTVHILGIPLDGRPGTQAISDTDGGLLDDDTTWDRAVGPMQFIPGTWGRWAIDGNADEKADPHNIYDAATAAASYLCFSRGDLDSEAKIRQALLAYNRSVPYGTKVLTEGGNYRDALTLGDTAPRPQTPN